jgi:hypothetical protein
MDLGEWLTRGTVWLALTLYAGGEVVRWRTGRLAPGRWLNTLGCAVFLAHVACAFHFYHQWSHSAAYADTARQTAELTGWNSGAGLYVNYLFALVWVGEAIRSWVKVNSYWERPKALSWTIRGFFWFMIFNGAVVFAHGPMRSVGLLLSIALVGCWWINPRTARQ